jgi:hypothetical protein
MAYDKGSFLLKRGGGTHGTLEPNAAAAKATAGRIIVDIQGAYDYGHSISTGYDPMVMGIKYKYKEYSLYLRTLKQQSRDGPPKSATKEGGLVLMDRIPNDMLTMVWPYVVGFSLTSKCWGDVLVDGLSDIQWKPNIFDLLVLDTGRKRMIEALVRHHHGGSSGFSDLVQGKGEGTIFLLYGPPGVGKTLTAEAVAELLQKPLYSLSLGTLGTTAAALEHNLGQIMNLTAKWDALILLDEADSFLETRSADSSLERNAMVSVMLKLVEYFTGILFLTSNRIDSLDPAFQTRITLALRYEDLDSQARTKVWESLLTASGFHESISNGTIYPMKLAETNLNGREIKNALRLAMALSTDQKQPLSQEILLETTQMINEYKTTSVAPSTNKKKPCTAVSEQIVSKKKRWWSK